MFRVCIILVLASDVRSRCPAHDMCLGYTVSSSCSLTSGYDMPAHDIRLGYALSKPSSHLTSGRDAPTQSVRLGVCGILVLASNIRLRCTYARYAFRVYSILVLFAVATYVYLATRVRSASVRGVL